MNKYSVDFFATCPSNQTRVKYLLTIETTSVIMVEDIMSAVNSITTGYHEIIANMLCQKLKGRHTLTAHHHGVDIETTRGAR